MRHSGLVESKISQKPTGGQGKASALVDVNLPVEMRATGIWPKTPERWPSILAAF